MPPAHPQIPPLSPCSQIPVTRSPGNHQQPEGSQDLTLGVGPSHSQPSFYSVDSLPPLSPSSYRGLGVLGDVTVSLPPRKTHRRANSDIPFGFSTILQSSPPLLPLRGFKSVDGSGSLRTNVKREANWEKTGGESNGEVVDDLLSSYINLNGHGKLNSFRTENGGDSSDNEATSSVIGGANNVQRLEMCSVSDKKDGLKRSAGGDIAPTRHYRSVSMDSVMGKMNFVDESIKLLPSPGGQIGKSSSSDAVDANSDTFSLEFGNGVFNGAELKKIMASENLAEMALTDPKRVKRILANRLSAARSKERKMRYIAELENKVQTLQNEATALFTQVTLLQRDLTSLTSQNNELKFRLQAMEEQAHLRDALNDTLTAEVERLKIMKMELSEDGSRFSQLSINPQMFQLHHQAQQHSQQQTGSTTAD
ncbi:putative transcription factor bZIP family [Helianthus annuus]|uniref:transcription factor RF2a n=1 Tax=Helianthus annuus TaxID=4232 RepID=UPI000B8EF4CA|nr:transcription factor RF2a [Helianthus annuus]KAJ0428481.1 putative transcription factor bZIP family [Helianthus annuus]KAJ0432580.1 putative transcription factor bZIP family [Helianthus annuus]KAJ0446821.1 putative transcription factor bZIP family [Helianthus annuus]KAJ0631715.1 putative transcription factor bZIP family [Helianthus annuus]KAJ0635625.1 putative transcription factor bZIP family [Helianthus annuus]